MTIPPRLAFLALFAALLVGAAPAPSFGGEFRIGCWNVENLFDEYEEEMKPEATVLKEPDLRKKLKLDAEVIRDLNVDVLGLVEVENRDVVRRLCTESLRGMGYDYHLVVEETDPRGIDVGIISKRPFLAYSFALPMNTRGLLACRFMVDGQPVYVLVNHWKSRIGGGADKRMAAAERTAEIVQKVIPEMEGGRPTAVIVTGDLNDEARDASVQHLLSNGLIDSFEGAPPRERWTIFYDDRAAGKVLLQGFDHMLITPNLKEGVGGVRWKSSEVPRYPYLLKKKTIRGVEFEVPNDDDGAEIGYSDHLPVVTTLETSSTKLAEFQPAENQPAEPKPAAPKPVKADPAVPKPVIIEATPAGTIESKCATDKK
ncbi:MAG: endonuclease/exonuclease/phosphatase family protein [Planctomycetia bacterium]